MIAGHTHADIDQMFSAYSLAIKKGDDNSSVATQMFNQTRMRFHPVKIEKMRNKTFADGRDRTGDQWLIRPTLYRLSYASFTVLIIQKSKI